MAFFTVTIVKDLSFDQTNSNHNNNNTITIVVPFSSIQTEMMNKTFSKSHLQHVNDTKIFNKNKEEKVKKNK